MLSRISEPTIPIKIPMMPVIKKNVSCSIASILKMFCRVNPISWNSANSRVLRLINNWFAYIKKIIIVINRKTEPTLAPS